MLFAVLFTDDPERAAERRRLMDEHLSFLERNRTSVLAAGPLRDAATQEPAGGFWLVEAADADSVRRLYESDPFWPTGLRRSVSVLEWRRVFADGRRLV